MAPTSSKSAVCDKSFSQILDLRGVQQMSVSFPEIHLLTDGGENNDYRPAIGPTGEVVVFERTAKTPGSRTVLYEITDFADPNPHPFLSDPPLPAWQTRPDWCWHTGMITFNGAPAAHGPLDIWVTRGISAALLRDTSGFAYPTWNSDGSRLVAMNGSMSASPRPCSSILKTGGAVETTNINGTDKDGTTLYGGMPAAKPGAWPLIAFAGQPMIDNWGGSGTNKYDQDFNYIFLNDDNNSQFSSRPMEPGASLKLKEYDSNYQGRAPAWSPDTRTIAFESNRSDSKYAIYLCDVASGTITQVTDTALGAQHAKFFPCGTKLIFSLHHQDAWAIAWVDISSLLQR
jgi:hypothetical protein